MEKEGKADRVVIDRKTLFALASETRLEILKKLDEKRMTLTKLSKALGISKAAVKEHLDKLVETGLVKRVDVGRKWVYYELTDKGKRILHPESKTKIFLLISSVTLCISFGIYEMFRYISLKAAPTKLTTIPAPTQAPTPIFTPTPVSVSTPIPTPIPTPTPPSTPTTPLTHTPALTPTIVESIKITPEMHLLIGAILIIFGTILILRYMIVNKV